MAFTYRSLISSPPPIPPIHTDCSRQDDGKPQGRKRIQGSMGFPSMERRKGVRWMDIWSNPQAATLLHLMEACPAFGSGLNPSHSISFHLNPSTSWQAAILKAGFYGKISCCHRCGSTLHQFVESNAFDVLKIAPVCSFSKG